MKIQSIVASACVAALSFTATSALAQARPAQPAQQQQQAPQITHGAALSGVCTIDPQASVLATNAVQAVERKINSEFAAEGQKLQQELAPYQNNPQSTPEALRKRVQDLQTKMSARRNNLQPAERQAQEQIANQISPTIAEVYQQRRCSVLIDRNVLVIGNPSMDITQAVVDRLNQKVPAPALAAAAPAAPAATAQRR
ncbi:OmpH family outer membrane protein [Phenylobacterium sp.]|jgi:outer membrane protein|uniref:OmpH family outer membrane protein n=1 Tax=Phenylobacterium sp. TaxID=1871053 RepID=UPI002E2EAA22|nr:OmpH family outer membrane protein [Phenylobacterium sp.]HEX2559246.1 OmpH family outer membrane protein [Phenylobacterium sp.]